MPWSSLASTEVLLRASLSAMQRLLWKVFRLKVETPRAVLDLVFLLSEVHTNQFKEWRSTTTSLMDLLPHFPSGRRFRNLQHIVHPMDAWNLPECFLPSPLCEVVHWHWIFVTFHRAIVFPPSSTVMTYCALNTTGALRALFVIELTLQLTLIGKGPVVQSY